MSAIIITLSKVSGHDRVVVVRQVSWSSETDNRVCLIVKKVLKPIPQDRLNHQILHNKKGRTAQATSLPPKLVDMTHEETNYDRHFRRLAAPSCTESSGLSFYSRPMTTFYEFVCEFHLIFVSPSVFSSLRMLINKINRYFFKLTCFGLTRRETSSRLFLSININLWDP